ncbi:MAG: putative sugar nucleotidyl transferase [Bacteroidota bacterium]
MAHFVLFEDTAHFSLLPLTYTRPVFALRSGILTNQERWEKALEASVGGYAYDYLQPVFGGRPQQDEEIIWINGSLIPDGDLLKLIQEIGPDEYAKGADGKILVARFKPSKLSEDHSGIITAEWADENGLKVHSTSLDPLHFSVSPDIFRLNRQLIAHDLEYLLKTETFQDVTDPYTRIYGKDNLFVAEGAQVRAAIINAEDGPIYVGPHSKVSEGAIIINSHALCAHATVQPGAKLRGDSTFGPWVKVGGEVGNSVIMGYANKGHDGYLGNSVIGYWCNLGADTNTSNLKNNYASVKIWNYQNQRFLNTGLQFCGLIMGDHSKCGINTMFNTGTVIGVSANIFGGGFPRNFIPSFAWGGASGFTTYQYKRAMGVADVVMKRRKIALTQEDQDILKAVFELSAEYRVWDKKA